MGGVCGRNAAVYDEDSVGLSTKWKHKVTLEDARKMYDADGTIAPNCSAVTLELRMHLAEPVLLHPFGEYARDVNKLEVLMCWADILQFKDISEDQVEYQLSQGFHIYHKYIKLDAVISLNVPIDEGTRADIKLDLDEARGSNHGVASSTFDVFHQATLELMKDELFVPYRSTAMYAESVRKLKTTYNQVNVDDFEYFEELGRGGFGCVVHCRKKSTGVHYAMKIQSKMGLLNSFADDLTRVTYEKEALASCHHPFIISMDYAMQNDKFAIMVMDIGTAGNLQDSLDYCDYHRMPEERVRFYSAEIVLTLAHIHRMGMIYRDLKPANVLLGADGHIQLVDLGGVIDVGGKVIGYHSSQNDDVATAIFASAQRDVAEISRSLKGYSGPPTIPAGLSSKASTRIKNKAAMVQPSTIVEESKRSECDSTMDSGSCGHTEAPSNAPSDRNLDNAVRNKETSIKERTQSMKARDGKSGKYKIAEPPSMKRAKSIMGTGGYMSPEMLAMLMVPAGVTPKGYNAMVDYWSLGITMYKLLTGKTPFHSSHLASFVDYIAKSEQERMASMPKYEEEYLSFLNSLLIKHANLSKPAAGIISSFLSLDYRKRLGYGTDGVKEIKTHVFFEGIDWNKLGQKHVIPPYIPSKAEAEEACQDLEKDVVKYDSFESMVVSVGEESWTSNSPSESQDKYFAKWDFISPRAVKMELGIEAEAQAYDRTFKMSLAGLGGILRAVTGPPSAKGSNTFAPQSQTSYSESSLSLSMTDQSHSNNSPSAASLTVSVLAKIEREGSIKSIKSKKKGHDQ